MAPRTNFLVEFSIAHPRTVLALVAALSVLALLQFPRITIDTDPENMLPADEPVRLVHHEVKERFALYDFLVVGIVDEGGLFTPGQLGRIAALTDSLAAAEGVVAHEILAPTEVDDIRQAAGGGIAVGPLLEGEPADREAARQVLERIRANPMLAGKLASDDGQAIALYIPLESKDVAAEVAEVVHRFAEASPGPERYHVAGLPVAEDSFGAAMFEQMAMSAPMAFGLIFLLMLWFFRRPRVVAAPMVLAMVAVFWTMGLLIGTGFTVHIMSSMIPIFLIPVSVLDSIHVLSSIHDHYRRSDTMQEALRRTFGELFLPMGFTSVTTVVGFAALIATPIPPVQVFGLFVAFGVFAAWLLSMTLLPAWAMLVPPRTLEDFGQVHEGDAAPDTLLQGIGRFATRRRGVVLGVTVLALGLSAWGISRIQVNDNPVKWFRPGHPLRVADDELRQHLAGTYIAYVELDGGEEGAMVDPGAMHWLDGLERRLLEHPNVGGASSVADIARKVQVELLGGGEAAERELPRSREALAQYLFLYEMGGGDPEDLYHFITPDQQQAVLWLQLKEGENQAVHDVVATAEAWAAENPPPAGMTTRWAGLSWINVVWQDKMVAGMGKALLGSFATVLLMMVLLFRSLRLGLVAMLPLTATIAVTYGWVGFSGRDYDMPIAVLSSLSLGLSIDFAIHLIERWRQIFRDNGGDFAATREEFFHLPAQALARNIVVIALGFVPMFFTPLVPYVTVAAYFIAIMLISGAATFFLLPALLSLLPARVLAGRGQLPEVSR